MTFDIGDTVRVSNLDDDGNGFVAGESAVTPDSVTLLVRSPGGTVTEYTGAELTEDATGEYHVDIEPDEDGVWWFRWEGTGPTVSAEGNFAVRPRAVSAG